MTTEPHRPDEAIAPADVRRALEQLLASETFRGSPQLGVFLRFVVEAVLRGEGSRIKGYTIGVEALGRPQSFDPLIDPIVRVEATRLRRSLERYYAGPGAADPIVFGLVRGSYVPSIVRRPEIPSTAPRKQFVPALLRRLTAAAAGLGVAQRVWLGTSAIVVVGAIMAGAVMLGRESGLPRVAKQPGPAAQAFDGPLRPGNGLPTVAITRIALLGLPVAAGAQRAPAPLASHATEKLRAALARFDTVNVAIDPNMASEPGASATPADYRLIGAGEFLEDGRVTVEFRLLDVAAGTIVWSRSFGPFPATTDYGPLEDSVVRQLAMTLGPPFGVIRARERVKHLAGAPGDPRARCIVEASESFRSFDPAQHARARACLEQLTARDPSFALGFAYLASVYTREYQYGLGTTTIDESLLDRALRAARQGVELSPESARAYQMLFTVLFARRDMAAAFAAGDRAIALNPYDMTILSDYGGRLIMTGETDRGMDAVSRAAEEGAVRPSWYHFYLFLGSYLKNDMVMASRHAGLIASETYPLGLLAAALSAATDGNRELARKTYDRLVTLRRAWREHPREELGRHFPTPAIVDRLAGDLAKAGLVVAPPSPKAP
jgi:tetratricopeptide (TPR) repeat protein